MSLDSEYSDDCDYHTTRQKHCFNQPAFGACSNAFGSFNDPGTRSKFHAVHCDLPRYGDSYVKCCQRGSNFFRKQMRVDQFVGKSTDLDDCRALNVSESGTVGHTRKREFSWL